jgi:hypothetical protein
VTFPPPWRVRLTGKGSRCSCRSTRARCVAARDGWDTDARVCHANHVVALRTTVHMQAERNSGNWSMRSSYRSLHFGSGRDERKYGEESAEDSDRNEKPGRGESVKQRFEPVPSAGRGPVHRARPYVMPRADQPDHDAGSACNTAFSLGWNPVRSDDCQFRDSPRLLSVAASPTSTQPSPVLSG